MCLITVAYRQHPHYPLIIAANRDEFYRRPSAPAAFWPENPDVLGGKDLDHMGTWLGITTTGRFAAITNYRDPSTIKTDAKSRGELVSNYLCSQETPSDYLQIVDKNKTDYNGFNLLVGDLSCLLYYSNRTGEVQEVTPGIHALSNHLLDTPWPKVEKAKTKMADCLNDIETTNGQNNLFAFLADSERPPDEKLPKTGVSLEWEQRLSSIFIVSPDYGTRCSTVILQDYDGRVLFCERTMPDSQEALYQFNIKR